jgi:hypothetical protein
MDDLAGRMKKAAEAVKDLPPDLRPVAFRFALEELSGVLSRAAPAKGPRGRRTKQPSRPDQAGRRKRGRTQSAPRVVDLKVDTGKLKRFAENRRPRTHQEKYAAVASFLADSRVAERVGPDEIYTCYKILGWRAPKNMGHVFIDARNTKGWFGPVGEDGKYELTHVGREFVAHDLGKTAAEEGSDE